MLDDDLARTISEMERHITFIRQLPAERPGAGRLAGQVLSRPDGWANDLAAAAATLKLGHFDDAAFIGPPVAVATLMSWIAQNRQSANMPSQDSMGRDLHNRIADSAERLLEAIPD